MKNTIRNHIVATGILVLFTHTAIAQWVQIDQNRFQGSADMCLAVGNGNIFAGTLSLGVFRCVENDTNWSAVNSGLTNKSASCFAISGSNIFLGSLWQGVFQSTDNGTTWTAANSGLTGKYVQTFAVSGSNIFAGTNGGGVFLSTNSGASWTWAGLTNRTVGSLAASGSNIFAAVSDGGVFRSSNNGATWNAVNSGGLPFDRYWRLAMSGSNIFAGSFWGVYRSSNNGATWNAVNSGLPESTWVLSFAVSGSKIFAGTSRGVFLSTDSGTSWAGCNSGLPPPNLVGVDGLAIGENYIFASLTRSAMHWIWRRPLSEIVGIINHQQQRGAFNFNIHFTSHTNSDAAIEFSLPHSDQVTVEIYNLSGRKITTLANKNFGPGAHIITWNSRNSAAGCYVVKMKAGSNTFVKSIPFFR